MLFVFLLLTLFHWQSPEPLPIAQVHVQEFLPLYAEPDRGAEIQGKARPHEVLWLYECQGEWGRSERGWLPLADLILEPAVVHYSANLSDDVSISSTPRGQPVAEIPAASLVGVLALIEDHALIYSREAAGWVALAEIEIVEPTPDLFDFVERRAYVKVESAPLFSQPDQDTDPIAELPLGEEVDLVFQSGDWVLVRVAGFYGWSLAVNFDALLLGQSYGEMNRGPVNLRQEPVDGQVLAILGYRERILILGQNSAGDWLMVRLANGQEGWVAAEFVSTGEEN